MDANNAQAKSGRESAQRAIDSEGDDPSGGLGNMFNDPNMISKLANNPKTSGYLADPSFMAKLQKLKQKPKCNGSRNE